jgi:iron complex outermembrane recepter protein
MKGLVTTKGKLWLLRKLVFAAATPIALCAGSAHAQEAVTSPAHLKRLSLEELASIQITSVARRPEPLAHASSAISVVTNEDIRRTGVTNIPDALRLATGLHVAQVDGHTWAISARGFNITTANKMQVLMDGRSLYTPLYSGVFWDVQHTFLPDLEQIEVIRGPGATLWGANAMNGVINIRTKSARDTQGLLLWGGGGLEERGFGGLRYGGQIGRDTYYRAYITHLSRDSLRLERGGSAQDHYDLTQGGFRVDSHASAQDVLTFQGDVYAGRFGQLNSPDVEAEGANLLARWTRQLNADSEFMVQSYYDYTHRFAPRVFEEHRHTWDAEFQHRIVLAEQHDIVWGGNYRVSADEIGNLGPQLAFLPAEETVHLISGFVQDEFRIVPDRFSLIAGSKFEYNSFSGFEWQPSIRFNWQPASEHFVWGAVSRAVRTPTRIDQDIFIPNPQFGATPTVIGSREFEAEELIAYELGYRLQPSDRLSLDFVAFYHDYDNLRSQEPQGPLGRPIVLRNELEGTSYGGAVTARWRVTDWWRLDGSVALLDVDIRRKPGSRDISGGRAEGNDPSQTFIGRSVMDLPWNLEFDATLRYVDDLPQPRTPAYTELDLRLGYSPAENVEFAIVGRNLLDNAHPEFRGSTITRQVQRSVFGSFKWRF